MACACIAYHKLLQTLLVLFPDIKTGDALPVQELLETVLTRAKRQQAQQVVEGV